MGTLITETSTSHHNIHIPVLPAGDGYIELEIDSLNLIPARYLFSLGLSGGATHQIHDFVENALHLDVEAASISGSSRSFGSHDGIVFFPQRWRFEGMRVEAVLPDDGAARSAVGE